MAAFIALGAVLMAAGAPPTAESLLAAGNRERARRGVPALRREARLERAAQLRAEDMARRGYFAHSSPEGRSPWDAVRAEGYAYRSVAENIARSFSTTEAVLKGWMGSRGHRENLLDRRYRETGIGVATSRGGPIVVQIFTSPEE